MGRGLTPFDRELIAYSVILGDDEAISNMPVVRPLGWFLLPPDLFIGAFRINSSEARAVIVKEVASGAHIDFDLVSPAQMMAHRDILDRLMVFDCDISIGNFIFGLLVDLSAFYYLPDLQKS